MAELQLTFLGGLRVARDGTPVSGFVSTKVQALLCYLALTGQPHLRPSLAGLLWGDMPEERANVNLRKALSNLRRTVGDYVDLTGQTVAFVRDRPYTVDVEEFARRAEPAVRRGATPAENIPALVEAAGLYHSDLLAGFHVHAAPAFEEWLVVERERLRDLAIKVFYALAGYYGARGENDAAIDYASRLLVLEPWHEEAHRQIMLLHARSSRRSAALAQYEACRTVLVEELGVEPMPETTALYERIRAASTRRLHLPVQPTPFVGREAEMARIAASFDDPACRLLTLLGPGGIGKTRLALHVAEARRHVFLDGVYLVSLAGIDSPEMLVSSIAAALSFSFFGRQEPKGQLLAYLHEKELLLVLDSFERVLAGAGLVSEILEGAPQVKVLATSRERLNLRWEWLFDVHGMSYPTGPEMARQAGYDAGVLFERTASRVRPDLALEHQEEHVARICRLVEGMPLAIELAAAAVRDWPCEHIAAELEHNLDLLATSARDVPERHRSVGAAFEGSWRTLTAQSQRALCRLAIFRGGGEVRAAEQVAGADRALIESLAAKSLLRQPERGRFELHEMVRHYAAARLDETHGERQLAVAAHAGYYATFLHDRTNALCRRAQKVKVDE
ncbi:MAG TPA: BTAD domain-containing putative transcriptional regulator, partial [Anaerolineae bacterium]|nr:BTAD domain-containing putative transcriptional regulator [Anaerolineae bacterium]